MAEPRIPAPLRLRAWQYERVNGWCRRRLRKIAARDLFLIDPRKHMRLLSDFFQSPECYFQDAGWQRILIISLVSLLFLCPLPVVILGKARRSNSSENIDAISAPTIPYVTSKKWWMRKDPSSTPSSILAPQTLTITSAVTVTSNRQGK
jgi:hypothetical protein